MTVLVTGGAGYIGSHMVHALRDAGETVVVLDNLSTGFRWALPGDVPVFIGETGEAHLVAAILAAHDVRDIIHFAASIVVPDSVADPLGYYRNNTANARTLIECAVKGGVKNFIFSSTAAVYGTPKRLPVEEEAPLLHDPAGRAGQSSKTATHLIKVAVQAALGTRGGLAIYGTDYDTADGTCLRDYI